MRIAVMGTGSLGGRYGGALAMAGNDVTFIARSQLQTISTEGLKLDVQETNCIHDLPGKRTTRGVCK